MCPSVPPVLFYIFTYIYVDTLKFTLILKLSQWSSQTGKKKIVIILIMLPDLFLPQPIIYFTGLSMCEYLPYKIKIIFLFLYCVQKKLNLFNFTPKFSLEIWFSLSSCFCFHFQGGEETNVSSSLRHVRCYKNVAFFISSCQFTIHNSLPIKHPSKYVQCSSWEAPQQMKFKGLRAWNISLHHF